MAPVAAAAAAEAAVAAVATHRQKVDHFWQLFLLQVSLDIDHT